MKALPLTLSYALILSAGARAQAPAPPARVLPATFCTIDFQPAAATDSAAFCVETTLRDSASGVMRVFYPSGRLRQYVPFKDVYRGIRYGTVTTWYENGQLAAREEYVQGIRHGELLTYYPDGRLKRRDHYKQGVCGIGSCYAPNGQPVPYFSYEQLPLYPGGKEQLIKELNKAVRFNRREYQALRQDSEKIQVNMLGVPQHVEVELVISPEGRIAEARIVNSPADYLSAPALRAVAAIRRPFVPAHRDGQARAASLVVPITCLNTFLPTVYETSKKAGRHPR
ncbi:hypothetical protein GCM10027594_08570 [Hymenobacter agri]